MLYELVVWARCISSDDIYWLITLEFVIGVNVKVQRCKILLDELVYSSRHLSLFWHEDTRLLLAVLRDRISDRFSLWEKFIQMVKTNHTGTESNFKKTRLQTRRYYYSWIRLHHFLWRFLFLRHVLHLVLVCLSRRCWIGFVNHAVRIARIIPRSCGIIKEVLPGTISPSSTETWVSRSGVADDLSGLHWSAHPLPVVNYLHLICLYLFLESTWVCHCREIYSSN